MGPNSAASASASSRTRDWLQDNRLSAKRRRCMPASHAARERAAPCRLQRRTGPSCAPRHLYALSAAPIPEKIDRRRSERICQLRRQELLSRSARADLRAANTALRSLTDRDEDIVVSAGAPPPHGVDMIRASFTLARSPRPALQLRLLIAGCDLCHQAPDLRGGGALVHQLRGRGHRW